MSKSDNRNRVLDDLTELRSFLLQRVEEERRGDLGSQFCSVIGARRLEELIAAVRRPADLLSTEETRHLLLMHSSARYLARSAAAIDALASQESRLMRSATEMDTKAKEMSAQLVAIRPELEAVGAHLRQVKKMAEEECEKKLGRRVNIIGEINRII